MKKHKKNSHLKSLVPLVILVGVSLFWIESFAIEYVESSHGLEGNPAMDGGGTELEFADINGDGNLDIISIGDHGSPFINTQEHGIMVWFGDGTGSWSLFQDGNFGYGGIAAGDVNGDGFIDVGYGMHHNYSGDDFGDQLIETALGDGTGQNWVPWDDGLATSGETYGMCAVDFADVDNDGDLDLGSNSFGCCAGVHVYLNQGDGTWVQSFGFTGGNSEDFFQFGDINNDGNMDFAVSQQYGTVYFGDGTGNFTLHDANLPPAGIIGRIGVSLNDIDHDGAQDLAYTNDQGGIEVFRYDNPSQLWEPLRTNLPSSGPFEATQLYDMDDDGWVDLVGYGDSGVVTWFGSQTNPGEWTWANNFSTGPGPGTRAAFRVGGDADHNGYADIAVVVDEGGYPNDINHCRFFKETSIPNTLSVTPQYPRGHEVIIGGSVRFIDWTSGVLQGDTATVDLSLSTLGTNGPWIPIAQNLPNNGRYQWIAPTAFSSTNCYIRYLVHSSTDTASALTYNAFQLVGSGPAPMLVVEPTYLNFDTVYVDSLQEMEFVIWNVGTDTLHVQEFSTSLPVYSLNAGSEPILLNPSDSTEVTVTFQPDAELVYSDSIFITSDGGSATIFLLGVGEIWSTVSNNNPKQPENFALGEPYPNPFNNTVNIPFSLAISGQVELKLINVLGEQVTVISNRFYEAGNHVLNWNASGLASGVYFALLKSGNQRAIRKIVLMK